MVQKGTKGTKRYKKVQKGTDRYRKVPNGAEWLLGMIPNGDE